MSRRTRLTRASTEVVGEFIDPEPGGFKYDIVQDAQGQQSLRRRQRDSGAHHRESDQGLGHGPPSYAGDQSIRLNRQRCGSCDLLWALTEGAADKGSQFKDGVDFVSVALGTHSLAFVIAEAQGLAVTDLDAAARAKLTKSFFRNLPPQVLGKRGEQKVLRYTNPLTGGSVKYTVRCRHYEERRELRADLPRDLRKIRVRLAQVRLSYLLAYTIKSFSHLPAYHIPPVIFRIKHTACACRLPNARDCKTRARRGSRCWSSIYGGRSETTSRRQCRK